MGEYLPLSDGAGDGEVPTKKNSRSPRLASLDVFRGLSIALMIFVDYAGSFLPAVAHAPWNGVLLADFVMPFFLFIAGVSVSLVYKKTSNKVQATCKAMLRAMWLFLLGVILQGGYFHGVNSLTFGVDVDKMRWLGILQRIAIGYVVSALCEIWSSSLSKKDESGFFRKYVLQWVVIFSLSSIYLGLLYGLYIPDWQFQVQQATALVSQSDGYSFQTVKCATRGDLGPACNAASMIDRNVLGIEHLHKKPVYRNLEVCRSSKSSQDSNNPPPWCQAPFEPEGILSSFMAVVTCIIGLHFGHILLQFEDHKDRIFQWLYFSLSIFALALLLTFSGVPLNKSLYTISYMLLTTASAGFTFCALYLLVDVYGYRSITHVLGWMGRHSLSIFVLVASNIAVIAIEGFFWRKPQNDIVHWVISLVVRT